MEFSLTNGESLKGVNDLCNVAHFFLSKACICHMTNLKYTPRRDKKCVHAEIFHNVHSRLIHKGYGLESRQSPSTGEWVKGVQYVCTVEYSVIKRTNSWSTQKLGLILETKCLDNDAREQEGNCRLITPTLPFCLKELYMILVYIYIDQVYMTTIH